MKTSFLLLTSLLLLSGCTLNLGQRLIIVHDHHPVYPVIEEPELQNLSAQEMAPWKMAVNRLQEIYSDGEVTEEEAELYRNLLEDAKARELEGRDKVKYNIEVLREWGRKNEKTLRIYNEYAERMNSRQDLK